MALWIGHIGEFDEQNEEWPLYAERLHQFLEANGVEGAEKKRATFLSVIGPKTYRVLRSLVAPLKPTDKALTDLEAILSNHFNPKPSVIVQRFRFHSRTRQSGESVATFISELQRLSEHCDFGAGLNDMIRDRLVVGIASDRIQRRLLSERELTFARAKELAVSMETAEHNAEEMRPSDRQSGETVHKSELQVPRKAGTGQVTVGSNGICYRCLRNDHIASRCPFRSATCFGCKRVGHVKAACRARAGTDGRKPPPHQLSANKLEDSWLSEEEEQLQRINVIKKTKEPPIRVTLTVQGRQLEMELDTGASASLISEKTWRELWGESRVPLRPTTARLLTYTGEQVSVKGELEVAVIDESGQRFVLPLLVVAGNGPSLMGRDWLSKVQLNWREVHLLREGSLTPS